jgi:hypothetical protein
MSSIGEYRKRAREREREREIRKTKKRPNGYPGLL